MLLFTALNGESTKEVPVMLRECQMSSSSSASNLSCSRLSRHRYTVVSQLISLILIESFWNLFPRTFSSVVLSPTCKWTRTFVFLWQHPDQLVNYTKHKCLVIVHMRQFVTQFSMLVYLYFSWQPANSYEINNPKKPFFKNNFA